MRFAPNVFLGLDFCWHFISSLIIFNLVLFLSENLNGPKNCKSSEELIDDVFESQGENFEVIDVLLTKN
jgi:hypothetical protein